MPVIVKILLIEAAALVYFIPAMIAMSRRHVNVLSIFLTNLMLGVTGVGWAIALIWAFTHMAPAQAGAAAESRKPGGAAVVFKILLAVTVVAALLVIGAKVLNRNAGMVDAQIKTGAVPAPTDKGAGSAPFKTGVPVPADELLGK